MSYYFPLTELETFERFCFYTSFFSPEECDRIIDLALNQCQPRDAEIGAGTDNPQIVHEVRKSKLRWIHLSQNTQWIFDRLASVAVGANTRYKFDLTGFLESLQFTEYEAPGSHYKWHQDSGNKTASVRKLSMVVHLTDPSTYEGGELELYGMPEIPKARGTVIVFPSYEQHRVHPVTKGTRHSLVAWVSGPPYR